MEHVLEVCEKTSDAFFLFPDVELRTVLETLKTQLNETESSCGSLLSKTGLWLEVSSHWSPSVERSTEYYRWLEGVKKFVMQKIFIRLTIVRPLEIRAISVGWYTALRS